MTNPAAAEYFQGVRVIAVRNFFESKCCILCNDIVSPIDVKISKCDACRCMQLTEECNRSVSARIILKIADGRKLVVWVHDRHICFIAKCYEEEVNEMKLLNMGLFSVHVLKHQVIGINDYNC